MRNLLVFISFILSIQIEGQSIDEVLQILNDKDLTSLKAFINESPDKSLRFEIFREVIPGYREGVLQIHSQMQAQKGILICHVKINFLSSDQKIFYYYIDKYCVKDSSGKFLNFNSLVDSFINVESYNKFEKSFVEAYGTDINKNDLFQTSIVYGNFCGIAGMPPKFRAKLDSLIKTNDLTSIRHWLRSPNSEKQLYAIDGLIQMEKKLYYISSGDRKVIDIIKKKKGQVNVCFGCLGTQNGIQQTALGIDNSLRTPKRTLTDIVLSVVYGIIAILLLIFSIKQQRKNDAIS